MSSDSPSANRYYGPNWKEIRDNCISSDGEQCVVCLKSENLVVHHRKPLSAFDGHEKANRQENLATLCERCHHRVESIQNHSRRGLKHFQEELHAESVDVPDDFIEYLCHNDPHSTTPDAECCTADGCFYPVKRGDFTCPSCGNAKHRQQKKSEVICVKCGIEAQLGINERVRSKCPRDSHGTHSWTPPNDYLPKTPDSMRCSECSTTVPFPVEFVSHLMREHDYARVNARKWAHYLGGSTAASGGGQ